ncbi:MAG: thermosome subunit alpha [Candidatus Bathyarchaeia archaeon]
MSIFREKLSFYRVYVEDPSRVRLRGMATVRSNIMAVNTLAELLKTTLGPRGMDKIVVETSGEWFITNDGTTILRNIDVRHPAAQLLVKAAEAQDGEVGDGTTSVVILAAELLNRADRLLQLKLHPNIIIKGYKHALDIALKRMRELAKPASLDNLEILKKICETSLSNKTLGFAKKHMIKIAVDAFLHIIEQREGKIYVDKENILVVKKPGKSLRESLLVEGLILDKGVAHPLMPKRINDAKIALISSPLKIEKAWYQKTEIVVKSMTDIKQILDEENRFLRENIVEKLLKIGANVVLCGDAICEGVQYLLAKAKIMAVKRVGISDLWRLTKATGGKLVASLKELTEADLGKAQLVEEVKIGPDKLLFIKGCPRAKSVSILLRAGSRRQLDEAERAFNDAIMNLITLTDEMKYVPGGGAIEMALASIIRREASNYQGKEQMAIMAFADSLEAIPRILAENSGLDSVKILMKLRSLHEKGEHHYGVEAISKRIMDMFKAGIIEPLKLKEQILKSAFEIVSTLLRIDEIFTGLEFFEELPKPEEKDVPPASESKKK